MPDLKKATPFAAFILGGTLVAGGQALIKPGPPIHVTALNFEPVPTIVVSVKAADGLKRIRVSCGEVTHFDGKASDDAKVKALCGLATKAAKEITDAVGSSGDLFGK